MEICCSFFFIPNQFSCQEKCPLTKLFFQSWSTWVTFHFQSCRNHHHMQYVTSRRWSDQASAPEEACVFIALSCEGQFHPDASLDRRRHQVRFSWAACEWLQTTWERTNITCSSAKLEHEAPRSIFQRTDYLNTGIWRNIVSKPIVASNGNANQWLYDVCKLRCWFFFIHFPSSFPKGKFALNT